MIRSLRIALADDEPLQRDVLEKLLTQAGHEVVFKAETGRALLDFCRRSPPDMVVADIMMPDMDGLDAAAAIYDLAPTPIVLVSGHQDQELIKRAARERPEWQWVFISNKSRGLEIEALPNTHFLPPVSYADLPSYAAGFDVCVLPWETEQSFTSYGSAIKVREYLATGKPVVISPLPEYEPMRDVLRIARTRDDFIRLVEEALNEKDTATAVTRQAAVASGTWDARAEWVSDLIEKVLAQKMDSA